MMPTAMTTAIEDTTAGPAGTRADWERIAPAYDRHVTPTHFWLGQEGLRRAGSVAGMRFLDLAAGSGALSIPAARLGAECWRPTSLRGCSRFCASAPMASAWTSRPG